MSDEIRVRFAPSPTGHLHVGGARTALYNWLYARKVGGKFVLRIEDTDQARSTDESVMGILQGLRWLGLDWDEGPDAGGDHGPYFQSERLDCYRGEADRLMEKQLAYPCFCTPEETERIKAAEKAAGRDPNYDGRCRHLSCDERTDRIAAGEEFVIRFQTPEEGETILYDQIRGKTVFRNDLLEDFVIRKSDGMPTYNFAVAVDDAYMKITHVIRGDDHISNTPRHILLFEAMGYKVPKFAHLPMILGPDKSRLSKRHGASSIQEFAAGGILPQGMMNYLALLGWSLDGKTEFFTPKKLVDAFSLKRVGKTAAVFDPDKLAWLNTEHFTRLNIEERVEGTYRHLELEGLELPPLEEIRSDLATMITLLGKRLKSFPEASWSLKHFFRQYPEYDPKAVEARLSEEFAQFLPALADALASLTDFTGQGIEQALRDEAESRDLQASSLIHCLRVAVTGRGVSPDIFKMCELLGRELVVMRLRDRAWIAPPATEN